MERKKRTKFLGIIFLILWIGSCSIGAINLLIESDNHDRGLSCLIASAKTSKLSSSMIGIGIISFFPFVFFVSLYSEQKKHGKFLFKRQAPEKDDRKKEEGQNSDRNVHRECIRNLASLIKFLIYYYLGCGRQTNLMP